MSTKLIPGAYVRIREYNWPKRDTDSTKCIPAAFLDYLYFNRPKREASMNEVTPLDGLNNPDERLIAAARDLLAVCERLVELADWGDDIPPALVNAARAAIAKAKGAPA